MDPRESYRFHQIGKGTERERKPTMARQTEMLIKPSLEELIAYSKSKLPDLPSGEVERFFLYYQSNGWKVGKNPMRCWKSALAGWRLRWLDRQAQRKESAAMPVPVGIQIRALEKTCESHPGNPDSCASGRATQADRDDYRALKRKLGDLYRAVSRM